MRAIIALVILMFLSNHAYSYSIDPNNAGNINAGAIMNYYTNSYGPKATYNIDKDKNILHSDTSDVINVEKSDLYGEIMIDPSGVIESDPQN